jgi:GTP-binding protein Era
MNKKKYCGEILIIGNQNTGKSSLMNKLIEKKISITSKKKNTTQENILGIKTINNYQYIYIDTPGFKKKISKKIIKKNFYNKIKIIILVLDKIVLDINTELILNFFKKNKKNILIVLNKIDKIKNKNILLPFIKTINKKYNINEIIPLSSKTGENINVLKKIIQKKIPKNEHIFNKNKNDNSSLEFKIHEIIREKIMRYFGDELPYITKIKINSIEENKFKEIIIKSEIFIKHKRQKKIFVGKKGNKIKLLSLMARKDIEKNLNKKIHLYIWVKNK